MDAYNIYVWNAGETPQLVKTSNEFHEVESFVGDQLETHDFAKVVASADETLQFCYQAFIDPQRGRQVVCGLGDKNLAEEVFKVKKKFEVKCFTPKELYALKPISIDYDLYLFLQIHVPEVFTWDVDLKAAEAEKRIEVRTLADECSDGRRTWTLQTIWFMRNDDINVPVMVVNSSGRDGDEYHGRWVTNQQRFAAMLGFLRGFARDESDIVSDDKIIPEMTEFYGATIHDFYDTEKQVGHGK